MACEAGCVKLRALLFSFVLSACGTPIVVEDGGLVATDAGANGALDAGVTDAGVTDAGVVDAGSSDAGAADAGGSDAGVSDAGLSDAGSPTDGGLPPHYGWAKYTLPIGSHSATLTANGASRLPLAGFTSVSSRAYDFIFDESAMYVLTMPAQPDDQLDWNKLPGLSDCGQLDLAQDGLMFAWRWRPDLMPPVLEIAQYANNGGTHLSPNAGLITLTEAELRTESPLHYELTISATEYRFHLTGMIGPRVIDENATYPRRCANASLTSFKWAAGFYFGGTSTAPSVITGWAQE